MRRGQHTRVPTRRRLQFASQEQLRRRVRSHHEISRWVCINCFDAANAPRNRYEKQSWLFQRPHGQQR